MARPALCVLRAAGCNAGFATGASVEGRQMKKRPTPQKAESSAPNKRNFTGSFPTRINTVTADVLARLLNYERLTGLESVIDSSTTRLSAFVHALKTKYGWQIEAEDKAVGCRDGRVSYVAEYGIPPGVVADARAAGAAGWCADVRAARRALRAKAAQARRKAEQANAAIKSRPHPGQWGLFEGDAV